MRSTIVSSRYWRAKGSSPSGSATVTLQKPPRARSSSRPKHEPESTRGMQHQSIEPSRATKATEWQSPIRA